MITEVNILTLTMGLVLYYITDFYVFRPLLMKWFPIYFIPHYANLALIDYSIVNKAVGKLKSKNKAKYNKVIKKLNILGVEANEEK